MWYVMLDGTVRSVEYAQTDILRGILGLQGVESFDCDLSYGNGRFYKDIPKPKHRFDIDPDMDAVTCDSGSTPLNDSSISSAVFDPPFLTYVRAGRSGNGGMVMARRFGGYWKYSELKEHYIRTLKESSRILNHKGVLVFKCQDIIHNHKMHATHVNVINWAQDFGFRLKDLYILPAKHRMNVPQKACSAKRQQKHARIYHSYFLVLEINKKPASEGG
jgi:hypothetical protein